MPFLPGQFFVVYRNLFDFESKVTFSYGQSPPRQRDANSKVRDAYRHALANTHYWLWTHSLNAVLCVMKGQPSNVDILRRAYCDHVATFIRTALLPEPWTGVTQGGKYQNAYDAGSSILNAVGLNPVVGNPDPASHQRTFYRLALAPGVATTFGLWLDQHYA